jgi:alanyl-tRNA synthetase
MNSNDIRRAFLDFFAQRGHRVVRSASLVPVGDPTLLFTNAGMNQFKDVFLGLDRRDYQRATSSQKCLRVSGKHNDLENVGHTRRHHTFFEMLGNFSFGDYFKQDAILFAWELMTEVYKLPAERLIPTVYEEDDDAFAIWEKEIGIPTDRIYRLGEEDNYWAMGDTGPCGPCSEIQYDAGPQSTEQGHKDCPFPCDCGRYVELWNLVFMQYNRDATGNLAALPKPSVDTGAGLERLATALQGKLSNYETDLFRPLIDHAAELTGAGYGQDAGADTALHVIADHSRAAMFVVGDGVLPSNEGRGYVLRKIMRRAIDYGRQLGQEEPFLFEMVGRVAELMREPYPELLESLQRIATVVKAEEEKYARLVVPGIANFRRHLNSRPESKEVHAIATPQGGRVSHISSNLEKHFVPGQGAESLSRERWDRLPSNAREKLTVVKPIFGEDLFYAYTTLGLRPDFVEDWAERHGCALVRGARERLEELLDKERERAKASWKGLAKPVIGPALQKLLEHGAETTFEGYQSFRSQSCQILGFLTGDVALSPAEVWPGQKVDIILDRTSFYPEGGGQVGDGGWLYREGEVVAQVSDTYAPVMGVIAHRAIIRHRLGLLDDVDAVIDSDRREASMRNHTGTHLLHAALRQVLGPHVKQAGSLVAPDRLRFDFSHYAALDPEELKEIEKLANRQILRDAPVTEDRMNLDDALQSGALAFFGDKYPEKNVRVITVADPEEDAGFYSKELCGGTHVQHTGQIGVLKVVSESSTAAGVRRVEALTGDAALQEYQQSYETLRQVAESLHVAEVEVPAAIERLSQQAKQLEKELQAAKRRVAHQQVDELLGRVRQVKDVGVLSSVLEGVDRTTMRTLVDTLKQKLESGVIVLGTDDDGKVALIAAVTKDLTNRLHAGKIAKEVAGRVGGTGGGRPDLAEAGGKEPGRLPQALEDVYSIVEKML